MRSLLNKNEIISMLKQHKITAEEAAKMLQGQPVLDARVYSYATAWEKSELIGSIGKSDNKIVVITEDQCIGDELKQSGLFQTNVDIVSQLDEVLPGEYDTYVFLCTNDQEQVLDKSDILQMFQFVKNLIVRGSRKKINIIYGYLNEAKTSEPSRAALAGFFRTMSNENPKLSGRVVEFSDRKSMVKALAEEVYIIRNRNVEVKYDGEVCAVNQIKNIDLPDIKNDIYQKKGVYLITGGAGGIGRILAKHLVERYNAAVFLTGRRDLSDQNMDNVRELCDKYPNIEYLKCDISSKDEIRNAVDTIKARHARISGVFHAAGVYHNDFILKKSQDEFEATLLPKVDGVVYIDEYLKDENLDFFVIFSSLAGVTGKIGQSDYTYANAFQDKFAVYREELRKKGERSGRTVSIDWPLWEQGGMTLSQEEQRELFTEGGIQALPTDDGLTCIEAAIMSQYTQVIITYAAKDLFSDQTFETTADDGVEDSKIDTAKLLDSTKQYVRELISKGTGMPVDQIEGDVNLDEYGVDSIIVNTVNSEFEKSIGNVTKTLLYECQTVDGISEYLIENHKNKLVQYFGGSFEIMQDVKPSANKSIVKKAEAERVHDNQAKQEGDCCDDIAIIGVSGRYPQAENLEELWRNLCNERDCVTEVPADRWNVKDYYDADFEHLPEGKMYCKWGGFLNNAFDFDPLLFNISPIEAEMMDPQERLFLEVSWEAMEDAGYTRKSLRDLVEKKNTADVGVFVGVTSTTYQMHGPSQWLRNNYVMPNSSEWSVANRVSYIYNLQGPSLTVDTACSSALSAVHLACESIRTRESSVCIVGGVNVYSHPYKYVLMSQMKMLSPTGRCHSFGNDGDGFVPGEGAGALILKSKRDAELDGDHIYAVIKSTAVNHDGKTNGYMVPSPSAQTKVILDALRKANIDPRTVNYIEAHGTGTKLGDPIEVTGLTKAFEKYTGDKGFCAIGSIKSNIGHLEAAAGVASITKVLLQMKYKKLVPTIHCDVVNSNIHFEETPFYLEKELKEWKHVVNHQDLSEYPYRAGVSSFGAGGSNSHVILEEYISKNKVEKSKNRGDYCIPISAKNKNVLHRYIYHLVQFMEDSLKQNSSVSPELFLPVVETVKKSINEWKYIKEEAFEKYVEVTAILEDICSALLLNVFQSMGIFVNNGEVYKEDVLLSKINVIPMYNRLLHAQLAILEKNGYLTISEGNINSTEKVCSETYLHMKLSFDEKKKEFLDQYSEMEAYARLLWICIDAYPKVWTGEVGYQDVMFPGGTMDLVKGIYRGNDVVDYFNVILADLIKEYIRNRVEKDPSAKIRILEVGAGTGGSSVFVLKKIAEFNNNIEYIYTDISASFVQYGKHEFGAQYPFAEFKLLDVEKKLEAQGYHPGSIDIVLGCNVFHATKNITTTMKNVRKLLKKNGLVLINEVTERTPSATMTFGLTNGWWLYEDEGIRIEDSPLISVDGWKDLLKNVGFNEIEHFSVAQNSGIESWQHVIMGQADDGQTFESMDNVIDIKDMSYTLCTGREEMEERVAFVANSTQRIYELMNQYLAHKKALDGEIYIGNTKSNNISSMLGVDLSQKLAEMVMAKLDIRNIAKLWTSGIRIAWDKLHSSEGLNRISLPCYPFDKRSYRILTKDVTTQSVKWIKPWIDSVDYKESFHSGIVFLKTIKLELLNEMKEESTNELMCLEMLFEANQLLGRGVFGLAEITIFSEINTYQEDITYSLRVENEESRYSFSLEVMGEDSYCSILETKSYEMTNDAVQNIAIASLIDSLTKDEDAKRKLNSNEISAIWRKGKKTVAQFVPLGVEDDEKVVHPQIWKVIMKVLSEGIMVNGASLKVFSLGKVQFYKGVLGESYIYIEKIGRMQYHIAILDVNGDVCFKISDLCLEEKRRNSDRMTYFPVWKHQEVAPLLIEDVADKMAIVLYGEDSAELANRINSRYNNRAIMLDVNGHSRGVNEYRKLLEKQDKPCIIYVLTGIRNVSEIGEDLNTLNRVQKEGIGEIYRFVSALSNELCEKLDITLIAVTNHVNQLSYDECVNFYAAGINGFIRNIVKEYLHLKAYTIDIALEEILQNERLFDSVVRGYDTKNGEEIVIRNQKCYLRVMTRTVLPQADNTKFRENGVYLVIGGLGSIGYDFACYLSENYHATLLITGVSELDDRRSSQLKTIESLGGKACYYRVDVADYDAMENVVMQIQKEFGVVNGIIHSAMNFKEEMIQDVTEDVLIRTLQPKMQGAIVLHKLFKDAGYDFMIFFSSGQSYTGNVKRAHYSAACNFEDCYARMLSSHGEPVKVVNWGFWGELKGNPITEEFRSFLNEGGVEPIDPKDGIEVVERFLESDLSQICTYNVEPFVLKLMGAESQYYIDADTKEMDKEMPFPNAEEQMALDAGKDSFLALKDISHTMLLNVFQKMGVFLESGETYEKAKLFEQLGIISDYERLYEAMLLILIESGYISEKKGDIVTTAKVGSSDAKEAVKNIAVKKEKLIEAMPEIYAYIRLLSTCMDSYPEILTGAVKATDIMFPNSSMDLVGPIYRGNAGIDYFNQIIAENVSDFIKKRDDNIRILEIGAGTGGTSTIVLEQIAKYSERISYMYTDISKAFIQHGKQEYGSKYDFMEFKVLDIEKDVVEQEFDLRSYDIVICANVLHATKNISKTIRNVKQLMKKNAWLILNEAVQVQEFTTLTFGLTFGWWLYDDVWNRMPGSPLLSSELWKSVLCEEGFNKVVALGEADQEQGAIQNVIIAQSDGCIRLDNFVNGNVKLSKNVRKKSKEADAKKIQVSVEMPSEKVTPASKPVVKKKKVIRKTPKVRTREHIEHILSELLQLDLTMIEYDKPFMDFGVDSIMATKITSSLNEELGIDMQASDLFDYSTINDLTEYIVTHFSIQEMSVDTEEDTERDTEVETELFFENSENKMNSENLGVSEENKLVDSEYQGETLSDDEFSKEDEEMLKILKMVENNEIKIEHAEICLEEVVDEQ